MADLQQDAVEIKSIETEKPTKTFEQKEKFVFNQCCFCIPLRTGCLILAYLYLVSAVATAIFSIYGTVSIVDIMSIVPVQYRHIVVTALVLNVINLILSITAIPFIILLLIGLHKERRIYVKVYVIFQLVNLLIGVLLNIVTIALGEAHLWSIAIVLGGIVFSTYFILVMRSQYIKMGETASHLPG
ncbi:uncharacterized protein LOC123873307 [Maniola jurtina]|uniref:uncharacterized protein LOC123873307 n=1 Tax=Maniola jurtina TaxID=191418 RepID=UPI001E689698|nr:uncharacterized protein LOC123873307 [Maniola jurtina]